MLCRSGLSEEENAPSFSPVQLQGVVWSTWTGHNKSSGNRLNLSKCLYFFCPNCCVIHLDFCYGPTFDGLSVVVAYHVICCNNITYLPEKKFPPAFSFDLWRLLLFFANVSLSLQRLPGFTRMFPKKRTYFFLIYWADSLVCLIVFWRPARQSVTHKKFP